MYITTKVFTVFPIAATRPAGFKFSPRKDEKVSRKVEISTPQYLTEAAVTAVIASRSFTGSPAEAYAAAIAYQKTLKIAKKRAA